MCLGARGVVDTDADVRDKCTVHVDEFKCNGSKSLSRHRSFLSVMLCDFLTARAGTHVTSGPSFLDSQALHRTLVFRSRRRTSPFLSITEPVVEIVWLEYPFTPFLCLVYMYGPSRFYLASGTQASSASVFLQHVCSDTHRPFIIAQLPIS